MPDLVILGTGAFARDVQDVVEAINDAGGSWNLLGFIGPETDDARLIEERESRVLGDDGALDDLDPDTRFVIGVNDPAIRARLDLVATRAGLQAAVLVHPAAVLGRHGNRLGPGTVICATASLTSDVQTGRHVHINVNVTVGHQCRLDDYATLNPGCNVSGNVTLEEGVVVGTGATVRQGLSIGRGSVIGMGAAVIRDVVADSVMVGVPAISMARS